MTTLDGTAITEVERLALEANQIVMQDVRPGSMHLYRDADGELRTLRVDVRPQSSILKDVAGLKVISDANSEFAAGLFVDDNQVVLVSEDGASDRWTATLPLPFHPAFQTLLNWRKLTPIGQKELVRLLRTELRDHVAPTVIAQFASLKFTNNSEVTSQIRPTSSALNSNIRQQVAQENGQDAPETIELHVPVYDIPKARDDQYSVMVYVEYDYEKQVFLLLTVHGDLRAAQEQAVAELMEDLTLHADSRYPVVYGKPS